MNLIRRSSVDQWFVSVRKGNSPNLERILDHKTAWNIDIRDDQLRSALYIAAESGNLDCVRKLLDRGADPNRLASPHGLYHLVYPTWCLREWFD